MAKRGRKATYTGTLVYVDEPQVILLQAGKAKVVAVAIAWKGMQFPFVAVTVTEDDWERYARGNVDLRYLFTYPKLRRTYMFDFASLQDNEIMMLPWDEKRPVPDSFLPLPRFFSRDHSEPMPTLPANTARQSFAIDGQWDLPDFTHFYKKFSDVYAFVDCVDRFSMRGTSLERKQSIKHAFVNYPMRGGSSYVHFYDELVGSQPRSERIGVDSIQYASPGHVDINGRASIFNAFRKLVANYESSKDDINIQYNKLRGYLANNKLLKERGEVIYSVGKVMQEYVRTETELLSKMLDIPDYNTVYSLVDNNPLTFAKIILSFFRRIDQAYAFFAEGRVEFAKP